MRISEIYKKQGNRHNLISYACRCLFAEYTLPCGTGRIRTHERVTVAGFQDQCLNPLGHSSILLDGINFDRCSKLVVSK